MIRRIETWLRSLLAEEVRKLQPPIAADQKRFDDLMVEKFGAQWQRVRDKALNEQL